VDRSHQALPNDRAEVPSLTGLRFVAAFSVLLAHGVSTILEYHETPLGAVYWLRQASGFGMTLFFVLSGFVIHYNYADLVTKGRSSGIVAYLWARFARLYPLFLLMMIVYVLVSSRNIDFWKGHPERLGSTLHAFPFFLLSIQSWIYITIGDNSLIGAIGGASPLTWSISTEWFFYFAYPCFAWLVLRARPPLVIVLFAVLWCALWTAISTSLYDRSPQMDAWAVAHFGPVAGLQDRQQDSFVRGLLYFSPYLRIGEFVLGTFVAQFYVSLKGCKPTGWENLAGMVVFLAAAACVFLITYWEYSPNVPMTIFRKMNMNFALAPAAALLIFCAARYRNVAVKILTLRLAIALGEASYSIYLVHYVVLMIIVRLSGSIVHGVAVSN
jgi:peptidoglycan/LPS O-acetylase OafA/YrhL